LQFLGLNSF
jgi:hypothetical protein